MSHWLKKVLARPHAVFSMWLFDPWPMLKKLRALPYFLRNLRAYQRLNRNKAFVIQFREIFYASYDRFGEAAIAPDHYWLQDLWAACDLHARKVTEHVDVGSRIDGFVAHVLPFCRVKYVDIRPLGVDWPGLEFQQGSITQMPFVDNSVLSLSCLHVIEHIGLGRYGDPIDPDGYLLAARELTRVLAPGGTLLLGTPVGRERLCFDGHRIFDPQTIVNVFGGLMLAEYSLIDDRTKVIRYDAPLEAGRSSSYGCGLFRFHKP